MSKEYLESLEKIKHEFNCDPEYYGLGVDFEILESALHRLESIDNANPSEALECLEKLKGMEISSMPFSDEYGTQEVDLNDIRKVGSQLNTDFREYTATIKQALLKAQKEHNSINLLMQELDCKDFAELRKYARCGYEKLNKKYLKWEDLEFKKEEQWLKVKIGDNFYRIDWCNDDFGANVVSFYKYITKDYLVYCSCIKDNGKQFFNDLHLEVVEE